VEPAVDVALHRIKRTDAFKRFCCDQRLMGDLDVVKLPAHMRPASRFLNATTFVDVLEPCISICLQRTLELAQVRLWMFPLAIR
jgi:hypothetical protein